MKSTLSLVAIALIGSVIAGDVLHSRRLAKRFTDDDGHYNMSFFHVNDVHAHLDEYASSGTDCKDPKEGCFGGYARIKTKMDELREEHPDNLWLNAGDEFQGTLFYSFYGGEKIAETINDLKFDVMTLGNHEWDRGDDALGEFLVNLTFPIVSCNVKSENKNLSKTIKNYHIFKDFDIAVIGATTITTPSISSVGEGTTFLDPIKEIQKAVYEIRNDTDIKRIIALSHLGYDVDQDLAAKTEGLSLIVGGHSHTLLGDMEGAKGDYPTIVEDINGDEVFIVTAYRWGEYLGSIDLTFDKDGKALAYHGAPIHMDNSTAQDKALKEKIEAWRKPFEKFSAMVVGESDVELDQKTCQDGDCLLGEVMTDAMLEYRLNLTKGQDNQADLALMNAGGIRATIEKGNITRGEILTSFPFGNAIVELKFSGADLRKILEGCVSGVNQFNDKELSSWFQVSRGIVIEYNPDNKSGDKLVNVTIGNKPLDDKRDYRIVTIDFLAGGGDNIFVANKEFVTLDTLDEILVDYISTNSPLSSKLEKRVVATDSQTSDGKGEDSDIGSKEDHSDESTDDHPDAADLLEGPVWTAFLAVAVALMAI